jgi:hypothetical protein
VNYTSQHNLDSDGQERVLLIMRSLIKAGLLAVPSEN